MQLPLCGQQKDKNTQRFVAGGLPHAAGWQAHLSKKTAWIECCFFCMHSRQKQLGIRWAYADSDVRNIGILFHCLFNVSV